MDSSGMWTYGRLCPECRRVMMQDARPCCGVATTSYVSSPIGGEFNLTKSTQEEMNRRSIQKDGKPQASPRAEGILLEKDNSSHDDHKGDNNCLRVSDSSFPCCKKFGSHIALTESQYSAWLDQLEKASAERDRLEDKVLAMEEQRVLGESAIRELIEENRKLRAALEQAEMRLGITEIEQQSILAESQQLRDSLNQSLRELEGSGQASTLVDLATRAATPGDRTGNRVLLGVNAALLSSSLQLREREHEEVAARRLLTKVPHSLTSTQGLAQVAPVTAVEVNSRHASRTTVETHLLNSDIYEGEPNSLLASNRRLEARCCELESQLQRLRERFLIQNR